MKTSRRHFLRIGGGVAALGGAAAALPVPPTPANIFPDVADEFFARQRTHDLLLERLTEKLIAEISTGMGVAYGPVEFREVLHPTTFGPGIYGLDIAEGGRAGERNKGCIMLTVYEERITARLALNMTVEEIAKLEPPRGWFWTREDIKLEWQRS